MKTGISLVDLARKLEDLQTQKHDVVADTRHMHLEVVDRKPFLRLDGLASGPNDFPLQPHAGRQIAAHTGIPLAYWDRMADRAPDLLMKNTNTWFYLDPSRRLVRTLNGNARAFLSDRYQRIEHEEIAKAALPAMLSIPGVRPVSCDVTERKLYIHVVTNKITGEVRKGDIVEAGVILTNSEVGLGGASVSAIAWRLVCLNGMKMPDVNFTRRHVGRRIDEGEDLNAIYRDDTRRADDRAILLKIRDHVHAALDEARFHVQLDKMRQLADPAAKIEKPLAALEVLAKKIGATDDEKNNILTALIEGHDLTAWGMLNAVTAQAHRTDTYDRAAEFEAMGGQLLHLPPSQWKEILNAETLPKAA